MGLVGSGGARWSPWGLWLAVGLGLVGCREREVPAGGERATVPRAPASSAPVAAVASASVSASAHVGDAQPLPLSPVAKQLRESPITWARVARDGENRYDAKLDDGGDSLQVRLELAPVEAPRPYRGAIAFYRLSQALKLPLVPAAVERSIEAGRFTEVLQLEGEPSPSLRVLADGTLDAAVFARGVEATGHHRLGTGRRIDMKASVEVGIWSRWGASLTPAPDEDARLLRAFVGALVLDYLAGNVLRTSVWLDEDAHTLVLDDNVTALPPHPEADAVRRALERVRALRRFPRELPSALEALDERRIRQLMAPGAFDTWLITPRTRLELLERVRTLSSLISARVERDGDAATSL